MRIAVIGAGLIGSAAARHLAEAGAAPIVIGVPEGNPQGVYASHYDEARITRRTDADPVWSYLASASISRYPDIERRSGTVFHTDCGHLRCDLPDVNTDSVLARVRAVSAELGKGVRERTLSEIRLSHPYLAFPEGSVCQLEGAPSGVIHPRRLVRAQLRLAESAGARLLPDAATAVRAAGRGFAIETSAGTVQADRVLVCTGPHTNDFALTPRPLPLEVKPETVLLVEVPPESQAELASMPGIIWNFDHHPPARYAYVLPPIPYPDGRTYLKIGADNDRDQDASTLAAKRRYMESGGSAETARYLRELVDELIPSLRGQPSRTKPCLLTYSPKRYPIIDQVGEGWFVAVAGNGKSAKSSDEIGRLGANLVSSGKWSEDLDRALFQV
jgi:sarcosine oxidase